MEPPSPYTPPATVEPSALAFANRPAPLTTTQVLFSFRGRIPRRTFWLATVATLLIHALPTALMMPLLNHSKVAEIVVGISLFALILLLIWTSLAIRVKRWHDHGKSGWWVLVDLIPYLGGLITLVVLGCLRGTAGPNAYGDDPT